MQLANNGPGALTFTFGRNLSGQITSIGASDGAFLSRPGVTKTETVTSNRLNQVSSVVGPGGTSTYTHDANGNLTSDGSLVFAYDEENRLRTVALPATPGTPFASYEYDPLGRRRAKVVNGVATRYLSDGAEEIEERNGANGLLRQFVNGAGIDEHLAIVDATLCPGGGRCFLRTNWQGSTTHLVAQSGALVETYHYGPYGERLDWTPQDGDSGNPYRYAGRRYDAETGLYYYRARYYSPKLGRFLQTDPIGTKDDLNLYGYVGSNPVTASDSLGMCVNPGSAKPDTRPSTICRPTRELTSSAAGESVTREEEGVHNPVSADPGGLLTAGVGHLVRDDDDLEEGDELTDQQIEEFFADDVQAAEGAVRRLVGDLQLSQEEFDALRDLVFNVGEGRLSRENSPRLNAAIAAGDYDAIGSELRYTRDANNNVQRGLEIRSDRRENVFRRGDYSDPRNQ